MAAPTQAGLPEFLYHGTGEGAFRHIREEGLKPQNGKVYVTDSLGYAASYAGRKGSPFGNRLLRVKSSGFVLDSSNTGGDYVSNVAIPPQNIEVRVGGTWIKIRQYSDESIGVLPHSTLGVSDETL